MKYLLALAIIIASVSPALAKPTTVIDCYTRNNYVYEIENWTHDSRSHLYPSGNMAAGQLIMFGQGQPLAQAEKNLNVKCTFLSPADTDATPAPVPIATPSNELCTQEMTNPPGPVICETPEPCLQVGGTNEIICGATPAPTPAPVRYYPPRLSLAVAPNMTDKAGSLSGAGFNYALLFPRSPVTFDAGVLLRKPCKESGKGPHEDHQTTCSTAYLPDLAAQFHLFDNLGVSLGSSLKSGKWSRFFWILNVGIGR